MNVQSQWRRLELIWRKNRKTSFFPFFFYPNSVLIGWYHPYLGWVFFPQVAAINAPRAFLIHEVGLP